MRTAIVLSSTNTKHIPVAQEDVQIFLLSESYDTFKQAYNDIHETGNAVVPCSSEWIGLITVMTHAYQNRFQFLKWIGPSGQQTFIKKNVAITILIDGSFGISLYQLRRLIQMAYKRNLSEQEVIDYIFDLNYTSNGIIYDIAKWSGIVVPDHIAPLSLNDAQVYIARWGGTPGAERFKTPYAIK